MPNRNQSQDSSPKRPNRAPPCCRCNGINARCKFCACAKAGRACTCCLPAKHGKCSNRPTLFHDSTSTLTMVSSQPLPGSTACSPGPRQLSSSQPILRQLQVPSGPLAPVLSSATHLPSPLPHTRPLLHRLIPLIFFPSPRALYRNRHIHIGLNQLRLRNRRRLTH